MHPHRLRVSAVRQIEWEEFDLPAQPGAYEVVIEASSGLISAGTELAIYTGQHIGYTLEQPPFPLLPSNPGYALVGKVISAGGSVGELRPDLAVGARVLAQVAHGSHALVDVCKQTVVPLPEQLSDAQGALARLAYIALTALRVAPIQLGADVAVYGMGLVGHLAAQLYAVHGAQRVFGIDRVPSRLAIAEANGIIPINGAAGDPATIIAAHSDGEAVDLAVEATGNPAVVAAALALPRRGGRTVLLGSSRGEATIDAYSTIHRGGVQVVGAHEMMHDSHWAPAERWPKLASMRLLLNLLAAGRLRIDGLISHTIPARDALEIYDELDDNPQAFMGVMIDWGG